MDGCGGQHSERTLLGYYGLNGAGTADEATLVDDTI
jgi:hypothetical protein